MTERDFIELKNHEGYMITTEEPWQFQHLDVQGNLRIINPWYNKKIGYYYVDFDHKHYLLHRLVAEQFIPNPENLPMIDHRDRCRTNNSLSNIRWVSNAVNAHNLSKMKNIEYEFLDELPEGFESFTEYIQRDGNIRHFENLYVKIENGKTPEFITDDSECQYRRLYFFNNASVRYHDTEGKCRTISFSRISKAHNTISKTQATIAETENTLAKAILNLTEILKNQQEQQTPDDEQNEDE
jgi:hypothetical protein